MKIQANFRNDGYIPAGGRRKLDCHDWTIPQPKLSKWMEEKQGQRPPEIAQILTATVPAFCWRDLCGRYAGNEIRGPYFAALVGLSAGDPGSLTAIAADTAPVTCSRLL